jgi:hypothetical protein
MIYVVDSAGYVIFRVSIFSVMHLNNLYEYRAWRSAKINREYSNQDIVALTAPMDFLIKLVNSVGDLHTKQASP